MLDNNLKYLFFNMKNLIKKKYMYNLSQPKRKIAIICSNFNIACFSYIFSPTPQIES